MSTSPLWDEIYAAVARGDTVSLEELFTNESVRADIDSTEAFLSANVDRKSYMLPYHPAYVKIRGLVQRATVRRWIEVIEWFFSPAHFPSMRATLTRLLGDLAEPAIHLNWPDVLECVLASDAWTELLTETQQLEQLHALPAFLRWNSSERVLQILLAHGLDVNSTALLRTCVEGVSWSLVDVLVAEGACIVGSNVLRRQELHGNYTTVERLMQHGAEAPHNAPDEVDLQAAEALLTVIKDAELPVAITLVGLQTTASPPRKRRLSQFPHAPKSAVPMWI